MSFDEVVSELVADAESLKAPARNVGRVHDAKIVADLDQPFAGLDLLLAFQRIERPEHAHQPLSPFMLAA